MALNKVFESAQAAADLYLEQAQIKADKIVRDAEIEAKAIIICAKTKCEKQTSEFDI